MNRAHSNCIFVQMRCSIISNQRPELPFHVLRVDFILSACQPARAWAFPLRCTYFISVHPGKTRSSPEGRLRNQRGTKERSGAPAVNLLASLLSHSVSVWRALSGGGIGRDVYVAAAAVCLKISHTLVYGILEIHIGLACARVKQCFD